MRFIIFLICVSFVNAQTIKLEQLQFQLPGSWQIKKQKVGQVNAWVTTSSAFANFEIVSYHTLPLQQITSKQLIKAIGGNFLKNGFSLISKKPYLAQIYTTKSKLRYAYQRWFVKSRQDNGWIDFYVFEMPGKKAEVVLITGDSNTTQLNRTKLTNSFLNSVSNANSLNVPRVNMGTDRDTITEDHTNRNRTSIFLTTNQSTKLSPIPFKVLWWRGGFTYSHDDMHYAFDKYKSVYWIDAKDNISGPYIGEPERAIWRHANRNKKPFMTTLNVASLTKFLGQKVDYMDSLQVDQYGNIYARAGTRYNGPIVCWSTPSYKPKIMVSSSFMKSLAAKLNLYEYTPHVFRVTPEGNAWFVNHYNGKFSMFHLQKNSNGQWISTRVEPRFYNKVAAPYLANLVWGAPDWSGGWIFYSRGYFWRLAKENGRYNGYPLVKIDLPSKSDVYFSNIVVTRNNDIWFATTSKHRSHIASNENFSDVHSSYTISGRSRFVRIRLQRGKVQLGEISAESLILGLKKSGFRTDSGVVQMGRLVLDYATGGLGMFDYHQKVMYIIKP